MRIYYIGQLWEGSTTAERMKALIALGHDVVPFDTTAYLTGGGRVLRSLGHRFNFGPSVSRLNRDLINHAPSLGPVDLVWVDKGTWIWRNTLEILGDRTGAKLIHFTLDSQLLSNTSRHFEQCIKLYNLLVTTKPFELDLYRDMGAGKVYFALQGYDERFIKYTQHLKDARKWASDVCFVGHREAHYASRLKSVSEVVDGLRIWGPGWAKYARKHDWAGNYVAGDAIWGEDYLHALSHAKIALGLLQKSVPETTTTRTFEIPALGVFLLAERTDDHCALFEEGKEAEFFSTDEELKSKIRFYLENDDARKKIAAAGRERCLRSGYSSANQLKAIVDALR